VFLAVAAYQQLAEACDYPHLRDHQGNRGLRSDTVKSSIGLGMLCGRDWRHDPGVAVGRPGQEVRPGSMLKSLNLRRGGLIISCRAPAIEVIKTVERLERLAHITTPLTVW
jgi:(E)-4-hydroxy-3-methylbut-2-enyl-diphosphate synthase